MLALKGIHIDIQRTLVWPFVAFLRQSQILMLLCCTFEMRMKRTAKGKGQVGSSSGIMYVKNSKQDVLLCNLRVFKKKEIFGI